MESVKIAKRRNPMITIAKASISRLLVQKAIFFSLVICVIICICNLDYLLIKIFDFYFVYTINGFNSVSPFLWVGIIVPIVIYRLFEIIINKILKI